MDHLRHEIPLYINKIQSLSFIKIQSPIHKIKIPQFSHFPRIPVSPSNCPQCHQVWSGFKIRPLKHKILLNIQFYHLFVSYKCLIFLIFLSYPPPPQLHQREQIQSSYVSHVSWTLSLFFLASFILISPL